MRAARARKRGVGGGERERERRERGSEGVREWSGGGEVYRFNTSLRELPVISFLFSSAYQNLHMLIENDCACALPPPPLLVACVAVAASTAAAHVHLAPIPSGLLPSCLLPFGCLCPLLLLFLPTHDP
jgi:hypothetical protein